MSTTWEFCLSEMADPVHRLGLHGLWRLLHHIVKTPDLYDPLPNTFSWSTDDGSNLSVTFESVSDLDAVMDAMTGKMEKGILVPPGYALPNESNPETLQTLRAHVAILGNIFLGGMAGARRSISFNGDKGRKLNLPDEQVENLFTKYTYTTPAGKDKSVDITPHVKVKGAFTMSVDTGKKNKGKLVDQRVNACWHPVYGTWNNIPTVLPPKEAFVSFFSALAYVYVACNGGSVGVGVDTPTFLEANKIHRLHVRKSTEGNDLGLLSQVSGSAEVAALALLVHLKFPKDREYNVVASLNRTTSTFSYHYVGAWENPLYVRFHEAVKKGLVEMDVEKNLIQLMFVPVRVVGDDCITLYEQVASNLQYFQPWYTHLSDIAFVPKERLSKSAWGVVTDMVEAMENEMEAQIRSEMRNLYDMVANEYAHSYGYPIADAYNRADEKVVRVYLQRAHTKPALIKALADISILARSSRKGGAFTEKTWLALNAMMDTNPSATRSLLILACTIRQPKNPASGGKSLPQRVEEVT